MSFRLFRWVEKHWFAPFLILLLLATALWFYQLHCNDDLPVWKAISGSLFYSLQFVVLNKDLDPDPEKISNWLYGGLTFFQLALPLSASIALLGTIFRDQINPFWIRRFATSKVSGHHVILGYGDLGRALASQLTQQGEVAASSFVIAIDVAESDHVDGSSLVVLQGDALEPVEELFFGAALHSASNLYLLLPDENLNLRVLKQLLAYYGVSGKKPGNLRIHVRTESTYLRQVFSDWLGLETTHTSNTFDVRPINPYDIVARGVSNRYSPDCYMPTDTSGPVAQTVMVIGTSQMARALILRFARIGIYAPRGKLRILWVAEDVNSAKEDLVAAFPFLEAQRFDKHFWGADDSTDSWFYQLNLPSVELIGLDGTAEMVMRSESFHRYAHTQIPAAVYVCHDSEVRNIKEARDIQACLSKDFAEFGASHRLILAIQNQTVLGLRDQGQGLSYLIKEVCIDQEFAQTLVLDSADTLAKRFKVKYDVLCGIKLSPAWETLTYFEKESNRDVADHGAIKARYLGVDKETVERAIFEGNPTKIGNQLTVSEEVRSALYLMEQRRYRAFMFLSGFRHGACDLKPGEGRKSMERMLRVNSTLLDDQLSEFEQDKDTNIVDVTLAAFSNEMEIN